VGELTDFGLIVLLVAGTFSLAVGAHKATEIFPIPAPALFLAAAAVASDIWPGLSRLSTVDVERIAVVALIAILFDGGMQVGWARLPRTCSSGSAGRPPGSSGPLSPRPTPR
jgi:cell volume regulation protein A